jgi:predicted acyltransferase
MFHAEGRQKKAFPWASLGVLGAGIVAATFLPVSKHRVSASYVLISLGVSAILFLLFHWISDVRNWNSRILLAWGRNPLILYFLHYLLIGIFFLPGIPMLYATASYWVVLLEMGFLLVAISLVALWLDRKNIIIAL